jgi:hypothetical protein
MDGGDNSASGCLLSITTFPSNTFHNITQHNVLIATES